MFNALHVMVLKKMEDRVNRRDGFWNRGEIGAIETENWQDLLKDVQKSDLKFGVLICAVWTTGRIGLMRGLLKDMAKERG